MLKSEIRNFTPNSDTSRTWCINGHEQVQKPRRMFCSTRGHIPCLLTCAHVNRVAVFIAAESSWQFVLAAALGEA